MSPLYEYECLSDQCGVKFCRLRLSDSKDEPIKCPNCGYVGIRIPSTINIESRAGRLSRKLSAKENKKVGG